MGARRVRILEFQFFYRRLGRDLVPEPPRHSLGYWAGREVQLSHLGMAGRALPGCLRRITNRLGKAEECPSRSRKTNQRDLRCSPLLGQFFSEAVSKWYC